MASAIANGELQLYFDEDEKVRGSSEGLMDVRSPKVKHAKRVNWGNLGERDLSLDPAKSDDEVRQESQLREGVNIAVS